MTEIGSALRRRAERHFTSLLVSAAFACAGVGSYLVYAIACGREAMAAELVRHYVGAAASTVAQRTAAGAADTTHASLVAAFARGSAAALDPHRVRPTPQAAELRAGLRLALLDPTGRAVAGALAGAEETRAPLDAAPGAPLAGWTVAASLDPGTARAVAHVGSTRDWTLLGVGVFTLAAGLAAVAALQLRRERALGQLRADFVASVSHELRTPLAQIRVYSELLTLGWVREEGARRDAARVIEQESRRLGHLVDNVLHFARQERGPAPPASEPVALAPLLGEVLAGFAPLAAAAGTRVVLRADDVAAWGERDALRQVVLNLLDNAVKYGPRGQTVVVGAERAGDGVHVWVEDEGPGIAPEDAARVWEPFTRLPATARATVGSGIGLAVVRQLVTAMHGAAAVERGAAGGARIVVTLPNAPAPRPAPAATPRRLRRPATRRGAWR